MLVHWIWLAMLPDLSLTQKQMLLRRFSDPQSIFYGQSADFRDVEGITPAMIRALLNKELEPARAVMRRCEEKHIGVIAYGDSNYPARLKNIHEPPVVLYCKGYMPDLENHPVIGVVGTRDVSSGGKNVSYRMGAQIAACGGIVVSGGAAGVDTLALTGALDAGKQVMAILAGGVDIAYPAANRALFARIAENGCLVSEHPPGAAHQRWNFLRRNRLISGIGNAVVVVEAPSASGALNTAKWASEQGKEVFAVPGSVDNPSCEGSNGLLQNGATAAVDGWGVMKEFQDLYPDTVVQADMSVQIRPAPVKQVAQAVKKPGRSWGREHPTDKKPIDKPDNSTYSVLENQSVDLSDEEKLVIGYLTEDPQPVDAVMTQIPLPSGRVLSILTKLAVKGVVQNHSGGRVSLK